MGSETQNAGVRVGRVAVVDGEKIHVQFPAPVFPGDELWEIVRKSGSSFLTLGTGKVVARSSFRYTFVPGPGGISSPAPGDVVRRYGG